MTEAELRTNSSDYNAATSVTMGYQEIRNSAENWRTIMGYIKSGKARDLNDEPKKRGEPVILTGSGPSLDAAILPMKSWRGGVIAHYSQAPTLMHYGIEPDYIVALDAVCNWEGLMGPEWGKSKTKLICHPGIWPSLIENWPNEILLYRQNLGVKDGFGVSEQRVMYAERHGTLEDALASRVMLEPKIKTELTSFACTPPMQLFAAHLLGYGPVFLSGCDFAYLEDRERFSAYNWATNQLEKRVLPEREYIRTINGLKTDPLHMYYKKNFISACRLSMQQVYTTDHGAVTEVPFYEIEYVVKTNGKVKSIASELRARRYERYLAIVGLYVVEFAQGYTFVEVNNPFPDLENYLDSANRKLKCTTCGIELTSSGQGDHTKGNCPKCQKKTLVFASPVDKEKNMKRFRELCAYVEWWKDQQAPR